MSFRITLLLLCGFVPIYSWHVSEWGGQKTTFQAIFLFSTVWDLVWLLNIYGLMIFCCLLPSHGQRTPAVHFQTLHFIGTDFMSWYMIHNY